MSSKYQIIWENELKNKNFPDRYTGLVKIDYKDLKKLKENFNEKEAKNLIKELVDGKVLLVKNAFSKELVKFIKKQTVNFWNNNPDTFNKMIGCPDYHRVITPEIAKIILLELYIHNILF